MADESASESRPISVSEILARSQKSDGDAAVQPSREGRGRRRAGRDGAVTVSELTGEIPRISDTGSMPVTPRVQAASPPTATPAGPTSATPAPTFTAPTARPSAPQQPAQRDPAQRDPAPRDPAPQQAQPRPSAAPFRTSPAPSAQKPAPADADQSGPFPRAGNPVARRAADDRPSVDKWRDGAVAEGGAASLRPRFEVGRTASGMPGAASAPMSRDFSADSVARRMTQQAGTRQQDLARQDLAQEDPAQQDPAQGSLRERAQRAQRDRAQAEQSSADAVTGIIPVVKDHDDLAVDDLVVVDTEDDVEAADLAGAPNVRRSGFSEIMDDDFDAYRSFADVEDDEEPKPARRGFFRRLRGKKGPADEANSGSAPSNATPPPRLISETFPVRRPDVPVAGNADADDLRPGISRAPSVTPHQDDPVRSAGIDGYGDPGTVEPPHLVDDRLVGDRRDATDDGVVEQANAELGRTGPEADTPEADTPDAATPDSHTPDSDRAGATTPAAASTPAAATAPEAGRRGNTPVDLDAIGHTNSAATPGDPPSSAAAEPIASAPSASAPSASAPSSAAPSTSEPTTAGHERSPLLAWAQVIGEAVVGLAAGIGLFWGFTELWKWNVYFALILAVVVIFGIVTLAHIVRRSRDLTTTLLAMGVGLIVTIGPLVLLAT